MNGGGLAGEQSEQTQSSPGGSDSAQTLLAGTSEYAIDKHTHTHTQFEQKNSAAHTSVALSGVVHLTNVFDTFSVYFQSSGRVIHVESELK